MRMSNRVGVGGRVPLVVGDIGAVRCTFFAVVEADGVVADSRSPGRRTGAERSSASASVVEVLLSSVGVGESRVLMSSWSR